MRRRRNRKPLTNWMNSEGRAIGDSGVAAQEDDFGDRLAGGLLPPAIEVVLGDDAALVLQEADFAVGEARDSVLHKGEKKVRFLKEKNAREGFHFWGGGDEVRTGMVGPGDQPGMARKAEAGPTEAGSAAVATTRVTIVRSWLGFGKEEERRRFWENRAERVRARERENMRRGILCGRGSL